MVGDDRDELVDGASNVGAVASIRPTRSSKLRRRAGKEQVRVALVELGR
jgi:hypothetical protein